MQGIAEQNLRSRQMVIPAILSLASLLRFSFRTLTAVILLLFASSARADLHQHPVLLPANVDPSKCLACHNDKATGKYVHTAISMGCTTCHAVANVKGATYITLTSPSNQLCFTCHTVSTDTVQHPP